MLYVVIISCYYYQNSLLDGRHNMDIKKLKKLNELKEKGVLTQEEFDKQISVYLDYEENKTTMQSAFMPRKSHTLWYIGFAVLLVFFFYNSGKLPECSDSDVKKTLSELLHDNFNLQHIFSYIGSPVQISYDRSNGIRKCRVSVTIKEQEENLTYAVTKSSFDDFSISLDENSYETLYYKYKLLCDDEKRVIPLLLDDMKENLSAKPLSVKNYKELSFNDETFTRQCTSIMNFGDNKEIEVAYRIEKIDNNQFSVSVSNREELFYKYSLLCDNEKYVIPTLFKAVESSFNIKPLTIEKQEELSYDEKNNERQCFATINFNDNESLTFKYKINKGEKTTFSVSLDDEYLNKNFVAKCNILSEKYAEKTISANYETFNDIQLSSPELVSKNEQENTIICKSKTNLRNFPIMYYKLSKKDDGVYVALKSPFECNKSSMIIAQTILISNYKDFKNLQLRNPKEIEKQDDILTCQVYTNLLKLHTMSYKISKLEGENIADVYVNPVADVIDDTVGKMFKIQERYFDVE